MPMPELLTRASCRKDWKKILLNRSSCPSDCPIGQGTELKCCCSIDIRAAEIFIYFTYELLRCSRMVWSTNKEQNMFILHLCLGSCLLFIRSGQNHHVRHSEREKKARQTEKEVGRQHQGKWTGLGFAKFQRAVENREKWRRLVVKSPVVPQLPQLLRDG